MIPMRLSARGLRICLSSEFNHGMSVPTDQHRLFPLGLNDVHCQCWRKLADAIAHIEAQHMECLSCQAERLLCKALLEEAGQAVVRVRADRQRPRHLDALP